MFGSRAQPGGPCETPPTRCEAAGPGMETAWYPFPRWAAVQGLAAAGAPPGRAFLGCQGQIWATWSSARLGRAARPPAWGAAGQGEGARAASHPPQGQEEPTQHSSAFPRLPATQLQGCRALPWGAAVLEAGPGSLLLLQRAAHPAPAPAPLRYLGRGSRAQGARGRSQSPTLGRSRSLWLVPGLGGVHVPWVVCTELRQSPPRGELRMRCLESLARVQAARLFLAGSEEQRDVPGCGGTAGAQLPSPVPGRGGYLEGHPRSPCPVPVPGRLPRGSGAHPTSGWGLSQPRVWQRGPAPPPRLCREGALCVLPPGLPVALEGGQRCSAPCSPRPASESLFSRQLCEADQHR